MSTRSDISWGEPEEATAEQYELSVGVADAMLQPVADADGARRGVYLAWERLCALGADVLHSLGGGKLHVSHESGRWQVRVQARDALPVSLAALQQLVPALPPITAVLGLSLEGQPVVLDLQQSDVSHVLVCGGENAGKTTLLQSMVLSLAQTNRQARMQLLIIDHAPDDDIRESSVWEPFQQLPHLLSPILRQVVETADALAFLVEEMDYRLRQRVETPAIVVVIDRLVSLLEDGGQPMLDPLVRLAQRGADAGIHLLTATRHPDANVLDNLLRANLNLRIVGQVADARVARAATGLPDSQAEYLLGAGDFLAVAGEDVVQFQAAACAPRDLPHYLRRVRHRRDPVLLAQPLNIRPYLAGADEENGDWLQT